MEYTILVADDEKEIRELLRLYLENAGIARGNCIFLHTECKKSSAIFVHNDGFRPFSRRIHAQR